MIFMPACPSGNANDYIALTPEKYHESALKSVIPRILRLRKRMQIYILFILFSRGASMVTQKTPAKTGVRTTSAAAKPAVKAAVKTTPKPVNKAATAVRKPATSKAAVKKPVLKTALSKAVTPALKPVSKALPKVIKKIDPKLKKIKQVRDSFTMPETEYEVLGQVKKACLKAGFEIKKSDLLRIGVSLIKNLETAKLKTLLAGLTPLKVGRPKK
jgi:hypothetical protein